MNRNAENAAVVWSADGWKKTCTARADRVNALDLWFADLPVKDCPEGAVIEFTFFWEEARRWEGKNYFVSVGKQG